MVLTLNGPLKLCGQAAGAQFPSTGTFIALAVRPSRPRAGAFFSRPPNVFLSIADEAKDTLLSIILSDRYAQSRWKNFSGACSMFVVGDRFRVCDAPEIRLPSIVYLAARSAFGFLAEYSASMIPNSSW